MSEDIKTLARGEEQKRIFVVEFLKAKSLNIPKYQRAYDQYLEDLAVAARILEGKTVACKLIITPASRPIYLDAIKAGYMKTLAEAGAIITQPGCGLCCGRAGGILTDGEKVLATNNRNFLGRMGTSKVGIYLGSPATAATSAIYGKITMPENVR